ncbi:MAG: hypothetical protein ABIQ73_08370 [Acidimicrobiales bacterium]
MEPLDATWTVTNVDAQTVDRLASQHTPDARAAELGVDLIADPHREDDAGNIWTRLHTARDVRLVTPGSVVVIGSALGTWIAKVIAWDFEVSDDDPIVVLELLPIQPSEVRRLLARRTPAA